MNLKLESSNTTILKILALLFMTIDHVGFLENINFMRNVGRLAFPIFIFLLVHNYYYYSRNKVSYFNRLFILGLLSTPFYFYFHFLFPTDYLNIFFSLSFLVLLFNIHDKYKIFNEIYFTIVLPLFLITIEYFYKFFDYFEYGLLGILSGYFLYLFFYYNKIVYFLLCLIFVVLFNSLDNTLYGLLGSVLIIYTLLKVNIEYKIRLNKWIGYFYYPIHLFLLKLSINVF
jgi:hypothetical protein